MLRGMKHSPSAHAEADRGRLDRQAWIEAAYRVLVQEGVEQVRILPLAEKLGVTRGSFYWHFKSRGELLEALIALWRERNTQALIEAATRPARDFTERFFAVARLWLEQSRYDPQLDIALRDWARRDAKVFALVQEADDARVAAIARIFVEAGETPRMAFARARVMYHTQMGYYMTGVTEDLNTRLSYLAEYYEVYTARRLPPARAKEIAAAIRKTAKGGR